MPFDVEKFRESKLEPRTAVVRFKDPAPALVKFFGEGQPVQWTVRGLSGRDVHSANEAAAKQKNRQDLAAALAADSDQRAAAIREALGLSMVGKATPAEMAKRLEMFVAASVEPVVDMQIAVKFAEVFPVEFFEVIAKINELTGQGFDLVKPEAVSLQTPASSQACESSTSETATSTSIDPT